MAIRERKTKTTGVVYWVETRGHWEKVGGDRREAQRLNERRKKEVKAGTFQPKASSSLSVKRYLTDWLAARDNRAAPADRVMLEKHVLSRDWFASLRLDDLDNALTQRMVDEIKKGPPKLAPKYIANIFGAYRTAMRAAQREGAISRDVCMLKPGTISKKSKERVPYSLEEARALVAAAVGERLVWLALALYTGMRCGEVCGRRWRDYDPESKPLGGLAIITQYDDQPLKGDDDSTERPRRAPVHPDLAAILTWWWNEGFELTYMRKPIRDDFIVERLDQPRTNLTRTMTYKAMERDRVAAKVAKVRGRAQHATRHTFLTQARRASPQAKELAEKITHNAEGEMVDNYTHWEWEPLCAVISAYPSLLPNSGSAHGNAATGDDLRENKPSDTSSLSEQNSSLSELSEKPSVRVLESELQNKGFRETISEPITKRDSANERNDDSPGATEENVDPDAQAFADAVAEQSDHARPTTIARVVRASVVRRPSGKGVA